MATLSTTRNYNDGEVLVEADLDAFLDDIETFLNVTKINDDNIQASGITGSTKLINGSVNAVKLATDSVETAKIVDLAVTTAKINDLAVTTGKINDLAVTAGKIGADAVTTAKILDSNVTTAKINDGAVTRAKLATYYVAYNSGGSLTHTATGPATLDESISLGTITTTVRPVMVVVALNANESGPGDGGSFQMRATGTPGTSSCEVILERETGGGAASLLTYFVNTISLNSGANSSCTVYCLNGNSATPISRVTGGGSVSGVATSWQAIPQDSWVYVDAPAAGSHEYFLRLTASASAGTVTWALDGVQVIIFEL